MERAGPPLSIETEIAGDPASVRAAATWLRDTLRPALSSGSDAIVEARRDANGEWRGETGAAFCDAMARGADKVDHVVTGVGSVAGTFEGYAVTLASCQDRMADVRADARAAGLTVNGFTVESPGDGPSRPGPPPEAASQGAVDAYDAQVSAYNQHQRLIEDYNAQSGIAQQIWDDMVTAWDKVSDDNNGLDTAGWILTLTDVAGGLGGALTQAHVSALAGNATYFRDLASRHLDDLAEMAQRGRLPMSASQFYDDLAHYQNMAASSADDVARASRLANIGRFAPPIIGAAGAGVGIWYDMEHGGESAEQAVASNVGGFAASVGTGMLVGTMIGGPVGTAVGAVVGAGVGIFTSGMVDGLFENDGDVMAGLASGADAVVDTGEALADLGSDVGGAIVDGVGGLFD